MAGAALSAESVTPYHARRLRSGDEGKGKLLVAHDFKGGYSDSLFEKSYTFNWWHATSLFNYFSHHRISIPPTEWITAAHRQGVPILGTIIFEGDSAGDLYRMIAGNPLPVGGGEYSLPTSGMPVSSYYAKVLAGLAKERGFDGWLLNIEIDMAEGPSGARGLAAWLTVFRKEIVKAVGEHGKVLMYDSVITRGNLVWQERVNSRNLPFFLSSDGLFTNYEWRNNFPALEVDFVNAMDTKYTQPNQYHSGKKLQDIYTGVDTFGRQSHGDGGFGTYKGVEHLDPQGPVGLSVALFAPGWTWEPTVVNLGWDWAQWWQYDTKLWVGPPSGTVEVLRHHYKPNELQCDHGPFKPLTSFFPTLPPPDPLDLAFYTTFSPGVGDHWFVKGKRAFTSKQGWMDMDKQTAIGDLVWPKPSLFNDEGATKLESDTSSKLIFEDAWNGGNSVQLHATLPGGSSGSSFWLPIQTLSLSSRIVYEASVIYKFHAPEASLKPAIRSTTGKDITNLTTTTDTPLDFLWQQAIIVFEVGEASTDSSSIVPSAIGFSIARSPPFSSGDIDVHFLVGQISVYPHLPAEYKEFQASLLWIAFLTASANSTALEGVLEWEVGARFPHVPHFELPGTDEQGMPWPVQPTNQKWFPEFRYFNVYALTEKQVGREAPWVEGLDQMNSTWIGTTGHGGNKDRFHVLAENLRGIVDEGGVLFQIEGVLETGEVVRWNDTTSPFTVEVTPEPAASPPAQPQESANKSYTVLSDAQLGPAGGQLPYPLLALICIVAYLFVTSILYRIYRFRMERKKSPALTL